MTKKLMMLLGAAVMMTPQGVFALGGLANRQRAAAVAKQAAAAQILAEDAAMDGAAATPSRWEQAQGYGKSFDGLIRSQGRAMRKRVGGNRLGDFLSNIVEGGYNHKRKLLAAALLALVLSQTEGKNRFGSGWGSWSPRGYKVGSHASTALSPALHPVSTTRDALGYVGSNLRNGAGYVGRMFKRSHETPSSSPTVQSGE